MGWLTGPAVLLSLALAEPPAPEQVMSVPPALAERIEQEVVARASNPAMRLDLLVDFMFSSSGLGFEYQATPTRDATATFASGRGNCLSFTLLFMAMAREAGLEVYPREVQVPPNNRREANLVFDIGHVNIGVDTPSRRAIVDFEPDFLLAQRLARSYRGRRISTDRALAHFYNNRAAELLAQGRLPAARAWAEQALALAPDFVAALNTRGVIERRIGDLRQAERHFLTALDHDAEARNALFNLVGLYRATGDRKAMEARQAQLESLAPDDPYFQWDIGRYYEDLGELERARERFERAIGIAPGQDRLFYFSLARVLFQLGRPEQAEGHLSRALALIPDGTADDSLGKLHKRKSPNRPGG